MKNLFIKLFVTFLSFASLIGCSPKEDLGYQKEERTLNFYALNDFHGAFLNDPSYEQTGISKIGNFLKQEKTKNPEDTFIISSGDMFQGGAESNITYGKIVIEAMNEIGFDSMTIGNHEFDWGETVLKEMEAQMDFPLLGANIFYANTDTRPDYLKPYIIVKKEGIKVGIIGAIMPGIGDSILASISANYDYRDNIEIIKNYANELRKKQNCDIVVLSSHDGEYDRYGELNSYIDAIFLGHDHNKKSGKINGIPYVEGGNYGKYVSNIKLNLKLTKGHYHVMSSEVNNISTLDNPLFEEFDTNINQIYESYRKEIEPIRDRVLYTFDTSVNKGTFARFMSRAFYRYASEVSPKILTFAGCINSGGIRDDIPKGKFTYGDLIRVYPFENVFSILKIEQSMYSIFKSGQSYLEENPNGHDIDGYYYVATIDYVAYGSAGSIATEIITTDELARDIIAEILLNYGFDF